jgi:4-hydroxy-2-oxoheptanedioate aldolase
MATMRPSRVLRKLRDGGIVCSVKINLGAARVVDLVSQLGVDCVWLDMEHTPDDLAAIEAMIMAAKMHDVDAMVRVPRGSYSDIIRPLELDAAGIMVPHVMCADDARAIVRQTRFHPLGLRPWDGGNADGSFTMVPAADYLQRANADRFVIVQIEDVEALDHLDEIASLDGINGLLFGPGDFSQSLGVPGQFDDPRIDAARRRVAEVANKYGKIAATPCAVDAVPRLVDMGYRFLNIAADVVCLASGLSDIVRRFEKATA